MTLETVTLEIQVRNDKNGFISKEGHAGLSSENHLKARCLRDFLCENRAVPS